MAICRSCGQVVRRKRHVGTMHRQLEQALAEVADLRERIVNSRNGAFREAALLLERHGDIEGASLVAGLRGRDLEPEETRS